MIRVVAVSLLIAACVAAAVLTPIVDHGPHAQSPEQTFSRAYSTTFSQDHSIELNLVEH
jgi:hypothetical protein